MPVFQLSRRNTFPPPRFARSDGLLAVGGDLSLERLILGYRMGIFPWYSEDSPILWWSPDPRFVLFPGEIHIPRSLKKVLRKKIFTITFDKAFPDVIRACGETPRPNQNGTWIVPEMLDAYIALHEAGYAHSVEAWKDGRLAGGLYGVGMGNVFFGESMFAHVNDASKAAFVTFVKHFKTSGGVMIDCQVPTPHLSRFGAREIPRSLFLDILERNLDG